MANIIKSIFALRVIASNVKHKLPLRIGRKSIIEIGKNSRIVFKDNSCRLFVNRSWTKRTPFFSHFTIGNNATIKVNGVFSFYQDSKIGMHPNAIFEVGNGYINSGATITVSQHVKIGNNVLIGPNCTIRDTDDHSIDSNSHISKAIEICDNVWIGTNVTILKGVTIGEGSVVAAGAVVTKSIPPNSLAAGTPAKVIKQNIFWN